MRFKIKFSGKKIIVIFTVIFILLLISNHKSFNFKSFFLSPSPTPSTSIKHLIKVTRVIDGDTVMVESGQKVRYIGIDAPEFFYDKSGKRTDEQCFAEESYQANKNLVEGKNIRLEKDVSETDKYGRLLRYVYIDDLSINDYLVKNGYAKATPVKPDIKYAGTFFQEQEEARENKLGLWGKCPNPSNTKPTMLQ